MIMNAKNHDNCKNEKEYCGINKTETDDKKIHK
jgi:hypothetical protein